MDSIYDQINSSFTKEDIKNFLNGSSFSKNEIKIIEKTAYLTSLESFRKIFNMLLLNIIQPTDILDITDYSDDSIKLWAEKILSDNYLLDSQETSLNIRLDVIELLAKLGLNTIKEFKNRSISEYLLTFEYYNMKNLDNSYKTYEAVKEDFDSKIIVSSDLLDFSTPTFDNNQFFTDFYELFFTNIFKALFEQDSLYKLCLKSYLNIAKIEEYRGVFTDIINWQYPYNNYEDVKNELFRIFAEYSEKSDRISAIQTRINEILGLGRQISLFQLNRGLILTSIYLLMTSQEEAEAICIANITSDISKITAKIKQVNDILDFIKQNSYSLKIVNK